MKQIFIIILIFLFSCESTNKKNTQEELKNVYLGNTFSENTTNPITDEPDAPDFVDDSNVSNGNEVTTDTITNEFMNLLNNHRKNIGLNSIILNIDLSLIAKEHSINMANQVIDFGHDGFSFRCEEGRIILGGSKWCGENVAMGQRTAEKVFNAWLSSSGHRANIERANSTHTGFGYAKNTFGQIYWTQIFLDAN